jgi:hypothetical protein
MAKYPPGASPLYSLLNEINVAAENKLVLLALGMVVALPDLCVSLTSEDGRTDPGRYKDWCAQNLGAVFHWLTPDDLYSMRCGVLHNGRFGELKHSFARAIFMMPWNGNVFSDCSINDAYFVNAVEFVLAFTKAVFDWSETNKDDPIMDQNIERFMQYRADGFLPYVSGVTVVA